MRSCELKGQESNIGETEEWGETGDKKKNQSEKYVSYDVINDREMQNNARYFVHIWSALMT